MDLTYSVLSQQYQPRHVARCLASMSLQQLPRQSHSIGCSRMNPVWLLHRCHSACALAWRPSTARSACATSAQLAASAKHAQQQLTDHGALQRCRSPAKIVYWGAARKRTGRCYTASSKAGAVTKAEAPPGPQLSAAEKAAPVPLPTSDESPELLRIRHSVRFHWFPQAPLPARSPLGAIAQRSTTPEYV